MRMIASGEIEPLVIVGIYNAGPKRIDDYTPVEDKRLGGGKADAYGQMVVEELRAFVSRQYRTLSGAANCGMGGSSLGGLVTLYLGMRYPDVFGKLAVLSPSVWWRDRVILRFIEQLPGKTGQSIWLDIGTSEGRRALDRRACIKEAAAQEGLEEGRRPRVPRNRRRQAQRIRLGRTRRSHAEVSVSAARISCEQRLGKTSPTTFEIGLRRV